MGQTRGLTSIASPIRKEAAFLDNWLAITELDEKELGDDITAPTPVSLLRGFQAQRSLGKLQSIGLQIVGHDLSGYHFHIHFS